MSQPATNMKYGGRYHLDDRGQRYCDIFPEIEKGDINVSIIEPGAMALWHRHQYQSDYQFVVKGSLKVGVCNLPNLKYSAKDLDSKDVLKLDKKMDHMLDEWRDKYRTIVYDALVEEHQKFNKYDANKDWVAEAYMKWDDKPKVEWHYLSERNACQGPLYIPPGLWHGCYNYTNEQAILMYHITNKYDGNDEERCSVEEMKWPVEREAK